MRIVYGVCGFGLGHTSRSYAILSSLIKQGHKIKVIAQGQAYPLLSKKFSTIKIEGIEPVFKNEKVELIKSIGYNLPRVFKNFKNWKSLNNKIKKFAPDVIITDFEPFTALLAYYLHIPLISIDNNHLLIEKNQKIPRNHLKDFLLAKYAAYLCVPKARAFIILSLTKENPKKKNVYFVAPIIRKDIENKKPKKGKYVLVYLSKPDTKIPEILKTIPEKFIIYGIKDSGQDKNLIFKKMKKDFANDLASCKAVIATAGFSLISEAIYLKKPYFAIPKYHFEQTLNAYIIKELSIGDFSLNPKKEEIEQFLKNLKTYEKNLKSYKFNKEEANNKLIKILKEIETNAKK